MSSPGRSSPRSSRLLCARCHRDPKLRGEDRPRARHPRGRRLSSCSRRHARQRWRLPRRDHASACSRRSSRRCRHGSPGWRRSSNGTNAATEPTDWARAPGRRAGGRGATTQRRRIAGHLLGKRLPPAEVEAILRVYAAAARRPMPAAEGESASVRDLAAKDAPARRACRHHRRVATGSRSCPSGELLTRPDEAAHNGFVHGRLPAGGLFAVRRQAEGRPSRPVRAALALAVARGAPWLGFATTQGPVIYLALGGRSAPRCADHFRALGATAEDPILIRCSSAPRTRSSGCAVRPNAGGPRSSIVDPLFKFIRVEDGNDYAVMTAALTPLLSSPRDRRACPGRPPSRQRRARGRRFGAGLHGHLRAVGHRA